MQLSELTRTVEGLAASVLERSGAFLVDVQVKRERGGLLVQVFADTDTGISIEQCAGISRELGRLLDTEQAFAGPRRLEVSSPGLAQSLKLLRQYPKNVSRRFVIEYLDRDERRRLEGTLTAVEGEVLTFCTERGELVAIPFSQVVECRERLPW